MNIIKTVAAQVRKLSDNELFDLAASSGLVTVKLAHGVTAPSPSPALPVEQVINRREARLRPRKRVNKKANGAAVRYAMREPPTNGSAIAREAHSLVAKVAEDMQRRVEAYIKESHDGVSASDVAKDLSMPVMRAGAVLRKLREEGRVYMGGTRRFARYASTQAMADECSSAARTGADK